MPRKFLVVVDDSPEFGTALRYAARRARSTGGRVALLRVIPAAASDAHWSGVREEIERQTRVEAEASLNKWAGDAAERSGSVPVLLIEGADSPPVIDAIHTELARRLPQASRLSVPGAGHMVPITHPQIVAAAIAAHLAGC